MKILKRTENWWEKSCVMPQNAIRKEQNGAQHHELFGGEMV